MPLLQNIDPVTLSIFAATCLTILLTHNTGKIVTCNAIRLSFFVGVRKYSNVRVEVGKGESKECVLFSPFQTANSHVAILSRSSEKGTPDRRLEKLPSLTPLK